MTHTPTACARVLLIALLGPACARLPLAASLGPTMRVGSHEQFPGTRRGAQRSLRQLHSKMPLCTRPSSNDGTTKEIGATKADVGQTVCLTESTIERRVASLDLLADWPNVDVFAWLDIGVFGRLDVARFAATQCALGVVHRPLHLRAARCVLMYSDMLLKKTTTDPLKTMAEDHGRSHRGSSRYLCEDN